NGRLSSSGEGRQLLVSAGESVESNASLGDSVLTIEYLAEDNANAGIYLQGRYEIALVDTDRDQNLTFADAGGVQKRASAIQGVVPLVEVEQSNGQWQTLSVKFRAPRYDEASNKVANAMILEATLNGETVQKNTLLSSFTDEPLNPWETNSGPVLIRVRDGQLAIRSLEIHPADFSEVVLPETSGADTNEQELIDFVSVGKNVFQDLGCTECHAVAAEDTSMKTGPNLFGLFRETPRDREIIEPPENSRFTVKADFSYLERSVRSPGVELATHESGARRGEAYMPLMPPYLQQTLTDRQLDAIGYYLQTLNTVREQGPVIKLVEPSGPEKYDPLQDDLQFLVTDGVRLQRGPMQGVSARAIHVGQLNAVNYSFDPRILGIAKVWQGGFLDMSAELKNRGGGGIKTGFESREVQLGDKGALFAPLNAVGELIDFSFKESVFGDTETIQKSLWSDRDQAELIADQNARFLGYEHSSKNKTAAPAFRYQVGNNKLEVTTDIEDSGLVTVLVAGERPDEQLFMVNESVLSDIEISAGCREDGVWVL
ncbi:MAG: DUF1080 domain-containing protein, partial [Pseudomonadales bacterium]